MVLRIFPTALLSRYIPANFTLEWLLVRFKIMRSLEKVSFTFDSLTCKGEFRFPEGRTRLQGPDAEAPLPHITLPQLSHLQVQSDISITFNEMKSMKKLNYSINMSNDWRLVEFKYTLYVPNLRTNLVSVSKITDRGYRVIFKEDIAVVSIPEGELFEEAIFTTFEKGPMQVLTSDVERQSEIRKWHERLGHLNYKDVIKILRNRGVDNLEIVSHQISQCEICLQGNIISKLFLKGREPCSEKLKILLIWKLQQQLVQNWFLHPAPSWCYFPLPPPSFLWGGEFRFPEGRTRLQGPDAEAPLPHITLPQLSHLQVQSDMSVPLQENKMKSLSAFQPIRTRSTINLEIIASDATFSITAGAAGAELVSASCSLVLLSSSSTFFSLGGLTFSLPALLDGTFGGCDSTLLEVFEFSCAGTFSIVTVAPLGVTVGIGALVFKVGGTWFAGGGVTVRDLVVSFTTFSSIAMGGCIGVSIL
ncbi:hypothetical protein J437_LFUL018434 [Ladona fulva]|uniref:GAG-pre-integrase domain-containing protein n=1 Tax=Ladona fulva TaxID=123851 RepID=A0A8K0KQQ4_LADFU|nr:hypothetical protein J437_LFUL018434 [Ladona fulva]